MNNYENPNEFYERSDNKKGLIGALILHALLLIGLLAGLFSTSEQASGPVQIELWAEGTEQVVKPPAESRAPDPGEEDTKVTDEAPDEPPQDEPQPEPDTKPEPKPEPTPPAATPPKASTPDVAKTQEDPEIAIEEKRKKEEERQAQLAKELEQKKAEQEKKELEQKKKDEQKQKELEQKKKDDQKKKELEQKKKEEQEKKQKEEQEKKQKEEQEKKELAKKQEEQKKKEQEQQKKDELKKKAAADAKKAAQAKTKAQSQGDALRAAMRGDIDSTAGIKGGINDRNQIGGGGGNSNVIRAVQACVQPRLQFSGSQRLQVQYEVSLNNKLQPTSARVTRRSGNPVFDKAVQNALMACNPYPKEIGNNRVISGIFKFPK